MKTHEHELHYHYNKTCHIRDISFIDGIDCFGRKFYDNDKIKIGSTSAISTLYVGVKCHLVISREILKEKAETEEKKCSLPNVPIEFPSYLYG